VVDRSVIEKTLFEHGHSIGMLNSLFELYGSDVEVIDAEVNHKNFEKVMLENFAVEVSRIRRVEEELENAITLQGLCRGKYLLEYMQQGSVKGASQQVCRRAHCRP